MRLVDIFSIYFWTIICFFAFFLFFIQSVSLWILIFLIKVSNFLVDISKLQSNKFTKSTKLSRKRSSLPLFLLILMSSLILTSIIFGVPLISASLHIWCFSLLISLVFSADFLFASDNSVCNFLIFVCKSLTLFPFLHPFFRFLLHLCYIRCKSSC